MGNQFRKAGHGRGHKNDEPKHFAQRYQLGDELGKGAFSTVKIGVPKKEKYRPVEHQAEYAIKIIEKDGLSEDDKIGLQQEIEILTSISHPNIIELYEHYVETAHIYMVTELIQGDELFNRIVKKSRYSELEARDVVKTMLSTMGFLHEKGIIHRDLKPENILLASVDNDLDIKIADFGFAKRGDAGDLEHSLQTQCGTPGYISPEILGRKSYGPPADVWSMGVIVYILLGGYPPFYHAKQTELFKLIKKGKYQFHPKYWDHISDDAKDLIKSMLTVNPDERLTCSQLLHHHWITAGDETLSSRDISCTIAELKKWNAKRKFRAAVKAVMATNRIRRLTFAPSGAAEES